MALTQVGSGMFADVFANPLPLLAGGSYLEFAVVFLVLAVVAAIFGARGVAGVSITIAKWLVIIFIVLAIITFLL